MFIKNAFIVDGSYMLHRALRVPDTFNFRDSKDRGTGGIFMFFRFLISELKGMNTPSLPLVVFDHGLSEKRIQIVPNYKRRLDKQETKKLYESGQMNEDEKAAYEEDVDYYKEYGTQMGVISTVLKAMGIPVLRFDGWEGDDIITLCTRVSLRKTIVTDDKDMIQLLAPDTKIRRPLHKDVLVYEEYQKENNDPDMRKFVVEKSISGDPSDNIPQVAAGVGAKTAKAIAEIIVDNPTDWQDKIKSDKSKRIRMFLDPEKNPDSIRNLERNMAMIDLSRVETDPVIVTEIFKEVQNAALPNMQQAVAILNDYDIKDVDMFFLTDYMNTVFAQNKML